MTDLLVQIGYITGLFGLHGELKLTPTTAGEPLYVAGASIVYELPTNHERRTLKLASVRPHKGRLLVFLDGVAGASRAELYVGATLLAERSRVLASLEEDEVLDADLLGMKLYSLEGRELGEVVHVEHFPGSAMLVVSPGKRLVPYVKAFVREVNVVTRRIMVDLPLGLLEGDPEIDLAP